MQKEFDRVLERIRGGRVRFLLAVSGGVDSMTMASLFLRSSAGVRFSVAHCNFHLRGDESDADQALVELWCRKNGVEFIKTDFDTVGYASRLGISLEMAARELRYSWFRDTASAGGFEAVAVAHNSNDNAETLILSLLRGTGARGLAGMKEVSSLPVPGASDAVLVRPLLSFTREEIESFARRNGVQWREDRTNSDIQFKRNRIRNVIFPVFKELNPSFLNTFSTEMRHFSQLGEIADDYFNSRKPLVLSTPDNEAVIRIDTRALMADRQWNYLLYRLLEPYGFNAATLSDMERALTGKGGTFSGKVFEGSGYQAVASSGALSVIRSGSMDGKAGQGIVVTGPGEYVLGDNRLTVSVSQWRQVDSPVVPPGTSLMDAGKLSFPFTVRYWMKGDWMRPIGLEGKKKLSDIFTDLKWGRIEKAGAMVIASGSHVAALLGCRTDDCFKVTSRTRNVVRIEINS